MKIPLRQSSDQTQAVIRLRLPNLVDVSPAVLAKNVNKQTDRQTDIRWFIFIRFSLFPIVHGVRPAMQWGNVWKTLVDELGVLAFGRVMSRDTCQPMRLHINGKVRKVIFIGSGGGWKYLEDNHRNGLGLFAKFGGCWSGRLAKNMNKQTDRHPMNLIYYIYFWASSWA